MDIDITYPIQFGLLLLTLVTLNGIVLRPLLDIFQKREAQTEGADAGTERLVAQGNADMEQYQARMREARSQAQAARDALREEGREEERKILAQVRAEIADTLNDARTQVSEAEAKARAELSRDIPAMSKALVEKMLGRRVSA